jgi:hypothetical protein
MLAGTVIAGAVVSTTVMVNERDALLPAPSVAVQLTEVDPRANVVPEAGEQTGVTEPLTMSVAVAANVTAAPAGPVASAVMADGTVSAGAVVSTTLIRMLPLAELLAASVAEQLTVVEPNGNIDPLGGEQTTATVPSTMSVAEAEKVVLAPVGPVASRSWSRGRVRSGGVVSTTVR